jgi:flagellar hook-associated protein 2
MTVSGKDLSVSTITPLSLANVSQYSSDYQNVLNRAVQIAEIPLTALQTQDTNVLAQNTALGTLETAATSLFTSLQTLGTDAASQAIGATSSNPATLTATATGASTATTYTINSVTSIASAASEDSIKSYADSAATPVSASSTNTLQLTVGTQNYSLTLGTNNLTSLRDAINASGAPVTASILTTSNGNYLSVTANATGATALQLVDDPVTATNPHGANTELLTQANQGGNAEFSLNGIDIKQSSNTVNSVIPGVTLQLLQKSSTPVTVSLQSDPTQLSTDLQTFVTNYNALEQALAAQQGSNQGGLNGDPAVTQLQQTLRQITGFFTTSGTITNLGGLGISFADTTGTASFDQTAFSALSAQNISDGFSFLNSLTTGSGNFVAQLQSFTDPISGLIATEVQGNSSTDKDLQSQISTLTDRINTMQSTLGLELAKADAQEAELQSQQSSVNASLVGLNFVLYGQNPTN